jgi:hypothetical protein
MTISNELSSEIATALLAAQNRSPCELETLKEILLTIHSTLQRLTRENGAARRASQPHVKIAKTVAAGS